jgi:hypothetical protein
LLLSQATLFRDDNPVQVHALSMLFAAVHVDMVQQMEPPRLRELEGMFARGPAGSGEGWHLSRQGKVLFLAVLLRSSVPVMSLRSLDQELLEHARAMQPSFALEHLRFAQLVAPTGDRRSLVGGAEAAKKHADFRLLEVSLKAEVNRFKAHRAELQSYEARSHSMCCARPWTSTAASSLPSRP